MADFEKVVFELRLEPSRSYPEGQSLGRYLGHNAEARAIQALLTHPNAKLLRYNLTGTASIEEVPVEWVPVKKLIKKC